VREYDECAVGGSISLTLTHGHTFVILPKMEEGGDARVKFSARAESIAPPAPLPPPSPQSHHSATQQQQLPPPPSPSAKADVVVTHPSPPSKPNSLSPDDSICIKSKQEALISCRLDIEENCSQYSNDAVQILSCLKHVQRRISLSCRNAILSSDQDCNRKYLWPMEIASMLLLATASIVLMCTLLRCCCRYVCVIPGNIMDDMSSFHDETLSDEDDSVGSVTPLPSGVKMVEQPQQVEQPQEDEDELPAYTEVVAGATIARSSSPPIAHGAIQM